MIQFITGSLTLESTAHTMYDEVLKIFDVFTAQETHRVDLILVECCSVLLKNVNSSRHTQLLRYHDLPKRTGTDRNGPTKMPKRTSMGTETDRNGPVGTETDRNRLQLIPKRTSMGTRKGRVGYDRNDPNKVMNVLVGRYVGRYVCR